MRTTPAKWLARIGRVLLGAGTLLLLFVAYQLWGTGLYTARAQDRLEAEFDASVAAAEAPTATTAPTATSPAPTTSTTTRVAVDPATLVAGDPIGRLVIPAIDLDWIVVHGVSVEDLKKGPGHYPGTPLPGQPGNAAIAGHRTTYGAPFFRIDELVAGDEILVTTIEGEFRYLVTGQEIVAPDRVDVLQDFGDNRLTLTSCHPRYSARQRIIVAAALDEPAQPVVTPPTPVEVVDDPRPSPALVEAGLSGSRPSIVPAIVWGVAVVSVWLAAWYLGRRWRRRAAFALATPVLLVVLFVFFENVSLLLPANF